MPNQYFQFKRFRIEQDKCSMKVCTDSCLFGAWVAPKIAAQNSRLVLDIGTGTGLLSLMIAQKTTSLIHGVDIDTDAFRQAQFNFEASPWGNRLGSFNANIKSLDLTGKYDFIVSNPPFFENDLLPVDKGKKNSKHDHNLNLAQLIVVVDALLEEQGLFAILLPHARSFAFQQQAANSGLFTNERLLVRHSEKHDYFRQFLLLSRLPKRLLSQELAVKNTNNVYSGEFVELLKDYYLNL